MLKVGLEGNIASGKSEAEKIIKDCGYYVFDLDKVVHNILKTNESVKADIYGFFHTLEREKIAKIIAIEK